MEGNSSQLDTVEEWRQQRTLQDKEQDMANMTHCQQPNSPIISTLSARSTHAAWRSKVTRRRQNMVHGSWSHGCWSCLYLSPQGTTLNLHMATCSRPESAALFSARVHISHWMSWIFLSVYMAPQIWRTDHFQLMILDLLMRVCQITFVSV